jgi:hypothetical protein
MMPKILARSDQNHILGPIKEYIHCDFPQMDETVMIFHKGGMLISLRNRFPSGTSAIPQDDQVNAIR